MTVSCCVQCNPKLIWKKINKMNVQNALTLSHLRVADIFLAYSFIYITFTKYYSAMFKIHLELIDSGPESAHCDLYCTV